MVDIIIPAYNAHDTIETTLISICMQTYVKKAKVYIVDDCSSKGYDEVVKKFSKLMNLNLLRVEKNGGPGKARQYGIDHSNSEYIMFLDSDDLLYNLYALQSLYDGIQGYDMSTAIMFDESDNGMRKFLNHSGCLHAKMYKRSFLENNDICFNGTGSSEDNGFNQLVLLNGPKLNVVEKDVYFYSNNKNSITQKDKDYAFYSIEWFIYNMIWAIKNGKKNKCDDSKIGELVCSSIYYVFFQYLFNLKHDKANMMLLWAKPLVQYYKKYNSTVSDEMKYKIYMRYAPEYITPISVNDFINMVELSDNWVY